MAMWRDEVCREEALSAMQLRCFPVSNINARPSSTFKMTCWNCRGLCMSLPYLNALLEDSSMILVLSDHWLWSYHLYRLNNINQEYDVIGKADSRSTEERDGGRGCYGIGL